MPVKVRCPNCQKVIAAPDAAIGKAIRCPDCQEKIRVAAPSATKAKPKPQAKPQSPEDHLLKIDLSKIEDEQVKFCVNCHAELPYIDEDDEDAPTGPVVCEKCGVDQETGKLSKKFERIKKLKGVDPDLFHKNLRQSSSKYVQDNAMFGLRTSAYMLVTSNLCFFFFFMLLWCTNTPPKVFWGAWAFVAAMVTPGWTWFLTTVIVHATLEKQDVLKKVNFDFFLCGALGIKFLAWQFVFLLPFWAAAGGMWYFADMDPAICAIVVAAGVLLALPMFPIVMAHMSMPVTYPGWLPHKILPLFFRNAKACLHWAFWALLTGIPLLALWGVMGFLYFDDVEQFFSNVNRNTQIAWGKMISEEMSASKLEKTDEQKELLELADRLKAQEPATIDETVTFVPLGIWMVSAIYYGFFVMFNMRGIGLLTAVFKRELDLISMKKETKFVSKSEKQRQRDDARRKRKEEKLKAKEIVFDENELEDEEDDEEEDEG
ncbi:MAG: hypothetical protein WD065_00930 [Planctomycetaceae bacterium]